MEKIRINGVDYVPVKALVEMLECEPMCELLTYGNSEIRELITTDSTEIAGSAGDYIVYKFFKAKPGQHARILYAGTYGNILAVTTAFDDANKFKTEELAHAVANLLGAGWEVLNTEEHKDVWQMRLFNALFNDSETE